MSNVGTEIEENLLDYFKGVDNNMLSSFIDVFIYHKPTKDEKVNKFIGKFLEDNGLVKSYCNYMYDLEHPKQYFTRSNMSDRSMIDSIKTAMLSIAYCQFRSVLAKPVIAPLVGKLTRQEKDDLKLIIEGCERDNSNLMDDEDFTRSMFQEEEANELMAERKRLDKLFTKVLKILK